MPEIFDATKSSATSTSGRQSHPKRSKQENITRSEEVSEVLRTAKAPMTPLAAFCPKPENVRFEVQHDEEAILLLLRQHPIVNVGWVFTTIVMLLAPLILPYFPVLSFLPANFQFIAILGWYLIVFGFAIERFLMWFFNIYIITDERIIDVDFYNLLFKKISEAQIENIEDITSTNSGFLQSIIDYGDVRIQTAAEVPEIEFLKVPHPAKVAKFLSEMQMQEEREKLDGRVR